jgi:hypothetical protein
MTDLDAANTAFATAADSPDDEPGFVGHTNGQHLGPKPKPKRANSNSEILDRQPPDDRLAALNVCGGLLLDPALFDGSGIFETHFLDEQIKAVFNAMRRMRREGKPIDVAHLTAYLKSQGIFEDVGGIKLLTELVENAQCAPSLFPHYADRIKQCERRRRALHSALLVVKAVYSEQWAVTRQPVREPACQGWCPYV